MTATPARDPRPELFGSLFGSLFVLVQHLSRDLDASLQPLGLTSRQWLLLAVLDRWFPGHLPSLTEAAARYGSSRQNVKQVARSLERAGYLRLVPDATDHRTTRLALTDRVAVFADPATVERSKAFLDAAFAGIDAAQAATLLALVQAVLAGLARTTTHPESAKEPLA